MPKSVMKSLAATGAARGVLVGGLPSWFITTVISLLASL
jgi:hypothetical protein